MPDAAWPGSGGGGGGSGGVGGSGGSAFAWAAALDRHIDALEGELVSIRRRIHALPDPSGEERPTTDLLASRLGELAEGFPLRARRGPDGRGLLVDPIRPADAPAPPTVTALRADIDALRLHEENAIEYRSQVPGVMHACGHDAHSAILLGAVVGLARAEAAGELPWPVGWRAVFQPAEETSKGALEMIEAGALRGVDAILALHVDPSREVGVAGFRAGPFTAACDDIAIHVLGRGGHAARPHEAIDPIAVGALLVTAIYQFVPRAVDSHDPVVVTIGQIQAGHSPNVIPHELTLRGTLRTLNNVTRQRAREHLLRLARGVEEASGARIAVEFQSGPRSVHNDPALDALLRAAARDALGPAAVEEIPRPSMGGEDFAHYLDHVPGCMFRLGVGSEAAGRLPLHSPRFNVDERALPLGAKILARAAVLRSRPRDPDEPG